MYSRLSFRIKKFYLPIENLQKMTKKKVLSFFNFDDLISKDSNSKFIAVFKTYTCTNKWSIYH